MSNLKNSKNHPEIRVCLKRLVNALHDQFEEHELSDLSTGDLDLFLASNQKPIAELLDDYEWSALCLLHKNENEHKHLEEVAAFIEA